MWFISIVIIILLIYFLIIRPLTQRNRPQLFERPRGFYEEPGVGYRPYDHNRRFGRFGTFAGGLAAGALLTYLFEQGRIGFDQYQAWQQLGDQEIIRELMNQNILQESEIAQLQDESGNRVGDDKSAWDSGREEERRDEFDYNDQNGEQDQGGFGNWDNGNDDNWV